MRNDFRIRGGMMLLAALLLANPGADAGTGGAVVRGAEKAAARALEKAAARAAESATARSTERAAARSSEKVAARVAERAAARSTDKAAARVAAKIEQAGASDLVRDAKTPARLLEKPRLSFRYVDDSTIAREMKGGFPEGTHFTSAAGPGRPLSPLGARLRLGLSENPAWRISAELPAGQAARFNKVIGGNQAGLGEISLGKSMPWNQVRRVVPLSAPKSPLGARLLEALETKGKP
jgi:hypothetical protein